MIKPFKIAIYSGEIPSTTFIERLICGVSEKGYKVYLFGYLKKSTKYKNKNIFVVTYSDNRVQKFFHLVKYSILLFLFRNKEKKKIDNYIYQNSKNKLYSKIKYYPILWHKPDVFHLQWVRWVEDWVWVQDFGIKLVISLRGAQINYTPLINTEVAQLYKKIFPKVDGFHAVSKAIAVEAVKYGANPNIIKVVYSGLKELDKEKKSSENQKFKILSISRNHWVKGNQYAIQACKILKGLEFDFEYQIIGGKDSEELSFIVANLELQNDVILKGNISFAEVQRLIINADVLLLSSVEEGIANVVLEAMQLGTIVITTDCGGMDEVVEDERNGFIVPIRRADKISETIIKIASLSDEAKMRIILEAKKTILKQHTEQKMVSDMLDLYKKTIVQ